MVIAFLPTLVAVCHIGSMRRCDSSITWFRFSILFGALFHVPVCVLWPPVVSVLPGRVLVPLLGCLSGACVLLVAPFVGGLLHRHSDFWWKLSACVAMASIDVVWALCGVPSMWFLITLVPITGAMRCCMLLSALASAATYSLVQVWHGEQHLSNIVMMPFFLHNIVLPVVMLLLQFMRPMRPEVHETCWVGLRGGIAVRDSTGDGMASPYTPQRTGSQPHLFKQTFAYKAKEFPKRHFEPTDGFEIHDPKYIAAMLLCCVWNTSFLAMMRRQTARLTCI